MFGSSVLDTMVGLAFVYLFLSILVSAANEILSSILGWRAQGLAQGVKALLNGSAGGSALFQQVMNHPLIAGIAPAPSLASRIPILKNFITGGASYIPSQNFALALLDAVLPERHLMANPPLPTIRAAIDQRVADPQARQALQALLTNAGNDLSKWSQEVETWFNAGMDRVSGLYKRKIVFWTVVLGALLASLLNVDTLVLARNLFHDSALRSSLATMAQQTVAQAAPAPAAANGGGATAAGGSAPVALPTAQATVQKVLAQADVFPSLFGDWSIPPKGGAFSWWCLKVLGILLTTLAVSLGTPFWFDLLGKLVPLRAAGPKPEIK